MIRVVIDTNVLVSSLLSRDGNEALVLLAIQADLITPCITAEILDEYTGVLTRPRFGFPAHEVAEVVALVQSKGWFVQGEYTPVPSPDPSDTKFLNCAYAGFAEFLVTGNKRHFPTSPYGST